MLGGDRGQASVPDAEERLEIVLGEDLERDHRLRALDPLDLGEAVRDHLRDLLGVADAQDRDEVVLAGDAVGLGDPLDVGQLAAEGLERGPRGADQDDGVGHRSVCVSPGSSTSTSEKPASWTSFLNAWASVSTGGNVP